DKGIHIAMDEMKNTRKDLSLNKTRASSPSIAVKLLSLLVFGGVLGKKKLKTPNNIDENAAIRKVSTEFSNPKKLIIKPAAIQPTVPKTRMAGNSLPGSLS